MADEKQLAMLKSGVEAWNNWRKENKKVKIDLSEANLYESNLSKANLRKANLSKANLGKANLNDANLVGANLSGANITNADLVEANLSRANLTGADIHSTNLILTRLNEADLSGAVLHFVNFAGADLRKANLSNVSLFGSNLVTANIDGAIISNSYVYGVSVWDLEGEFKEQNQLIISQEGEPVITVDNIKVAQFVYLILNNKEIRGVLNTLTTKTVLILGRFTPERKKILDALREKLREEDFLPILFDFERSNDRDYTETIKTLAGLCYFVIADVTDPSSIPLELQATVPEFQIPFVTIIEKGRDKENRPFAMMQNLQTKYPSWMLPTKTYDSLEHLMERLKEGIIEPAKKVHQELQVIKAQKQSLDSL